MHVAVARDRVVRPPVGVVRHRLARFATSLQAQTSPPRQRLEEAVLDVAATAVDDLAAIATLTDAVQSRCTTVPRLRVALDGRRRLPRRGLVSQVLTDVADGTCSALEHGYLHRVELAHGLPTASRESRESHRGAVYRDVDYRPVPLLVELDGRAFHTSAAQRDRDLDRDLDALTDGRVTVRLGWGQVFRRACRTADRVGTLLTQRGWEGERRRCPDCPDG